MATKAVDTSQNVRGWQITLLVSGFALVILAIVLQAVISSFHSTTVVSKVGDVTTTTTGPAAPAAALVTTLLGAGAVLILAGAFFSKISKIVLTGIGEIDMSTQADIAGKAAAATDDPAKAKSLVAKTNDKVLTAIANSPANPIATPEIVDAAFAAAAHELNISLN